MKKWKRRILTAWWVLIGKQCLLTSATSQTIYVHDSGPEGKIVQLAPFRDEILGLDNKGSIWLMRSMYGNPFDFQIQLLVESPRGRL